MVWRFSQGEGVSRATNIESALRAAVECLKSFGAREVYVFGSSAAGVLAEGSDVDLAVSGIPPERFFRAMGQAGEFFQCPMDLVDLDEDNLFTQYLKREGKLRRVA